MSQRSESAERLVETVTAETVDAIAKHASELLHEMEIWKHQSSDITHLKPRACLMQTAQQALRSLVPPNHHSECARMRGAIVTSVDAIVNVQLWKQYDFNRSRVVRSLQGRQGCPWAKDVASGITCLQDCFPHLWLNASANEVLLLHGTTEKNAISIMHEGFDDRLTHRHLYGRGVYFTTDSCKAFEYSGNSSEKCIIVARVILGHPFVATGPMNNSERPPAVDDLPGTRHDSVIARPGIPNGRNGRRGRQLHWEFIVPRGDLQIYPELLIKFHLA